VVIGKRLPPGMKVDPYSY
jgi:hypothetical protein